MTFIGSGDAFGSGGRHQACIALDAGARRYLLDCGATALVSMRQRGLSPGDVDAILLTHLHGDHFGGVPYLALEECFQGGRTAPLLVAGPEGTRERLAAAAEALFPTLMSHVRFPIRHLTWRDRQPVEVLDARVTPFAVRHFSGATPFALRVEVGRKIVCYSGDTEWTPALADACRGADLLVVEATSFDVPVPTHVTYRTLREHRAELACRRVVLTHLGPEMLAHRGDVEDWEVAEDGATFDL